MNVRSFLIPGIGSIIVTMNSWHVVPPICEQGIFRWYNQVQVALA